jgi:hypothetical protein
MSDDSVQSLIETLKVTCAWYGNITFSPDEKQVIGTLESAICNVTKSVFSLTSELMMDRYEALVYYMGVTLVMGLSHNIMVLRFLHYSRTSSHILHVAYWTAVWMFTFDFCVLLGHFGFARVYYKASRGLIACAFFHFCLFSIWDSHILSKLQALHYPSERSWWSYIRLWFYLFIALSLLNKIREHAPVVAFVILYSTWVPQIAYNALRNTTRGSPPAYVISTTITRLWFLVYFFGFSNNFAPFEVQGNAVLVTVVWCVLQVVVVFVQSVSGRPTFFVPQWMRPVVYDYHRVVDIPPDVECVICQAPLIGSETLVTPCNHVFHQDCLLQWAEVKLMCPICRRAMPPP